MRDDVIAFTSDQREQTCNIVSKITALIILKFRDKHIDVKITYLVLIYLQQIGLIQPRTGLREVLETATERIPMAILNEATTMPRERKGEEKK